MTNRGDLYVDLRPFVELVRGPDWMLAAAVIGIGAPLSEELLFRGFLLSALAKSRLGFWGAALIATALWTSLHIGYTVVGILEVSIIGCSSPGSCGERAACASRSSATRSTIP